MRDWSELQRDLLGLIAQRLRLHNDLLLDDDFVAFSRVCKSWRSVALMENFRKSLSLPLLMLPQKKDSDTRGFFSLSKRTVHHHKLPEASGKTRCWGSQGWLITTGENPNINLLNPLTKLQIQLPHKRTFMKYNYYYDCFPPVEVHKYYIVKAILSSNPSYNSDYVVMVIHGSLSQLAFARPGDEAWTPIITRPFRFFDIAYYKGKFYGININGEILVCDINGNATYYTRTACIVAKVPNKLLDGYTKFYIVESCGELLVVLRVWRRPEHIIGGCYQTIGFQVFRLDLKEKKSSCTEVENLGEWALFLGYSSSMSIKASDFSGCQSNCIYFTDDFWSSMPTGGELGSGNDMGIFNLEDRSIKPHYNGGGLSCLSEVSPPMWVVPSL